MDEIIFYYEGNTTKIKYDGNQKIREICDKFCNQINKSINSLVFKYEGSELNMDKTFDEIKQENNNNIFVCKIDDNKSSESKNEINCIYDKQEEEINLLHDYSINTAVLNWKDSTYYKEGGKNINENNIDIYINDNKIKFDYKYKSNERGDIKVKFIFRNLLTITYQMFRDCKSLISIDLSSFDTTNVSNMGFMFMEYSFLESIDLSLHNTTNIKDISSMFWRCSSLRSIDLSSFNPANINSMVCLFYKCSSLKKENVKFKNSDKKLISEINQLSN